jgi:hypothetical protein
MPFVCCSNEVNNFIEVGTSNRGFYIEDFWTHYKTMNLIRKIIRIGRKMNYKNLLK